MGSWKISIAGHGIHHNDRQDDAEAMAAVFVGGRRGWGGCGNGPSCARAAGDFNVRCD